MVALEGGHKKRCQLKPQPCPTAFSSPSSPILSGVSIFGVSLPVYCITMTSHRGGPPGEGTQGCNLLRSLKERSSRALGLYVDLALELGSPGAFPRGEARGWNTRRGPLERERSRQKKPPTLPTLHPLGIG